LRVVLISARGSLAMLEGTGELAIEMFQDSITVYYRGKKIPVLALYATPTLHYIQFVAPYVARRLIESKIAEFRIWDRRAARVIELACRGLCRYSSAGADISGVLEEAYYNSLADAILARAAAVDALVVPCADAPFARALIKRASESAPDLKIIASQYGGQCVGADVVHTPQLADVPLPLGPISRAALHTAMWAVGSGEAECPLTPLLDCSC